MGALPIAGVAFSFDNGKIGMPECLPTQ